MSCSITASIDLAHLRHNYQLLRQRAGSAELMAVVKANAYGHGLALIAPALAQAGCRHFAVTDADEGAQLRAILGDAPDDRAHTIVTLSGLRDANDATTITQHALTPAISDPQQLNDLQRAGFNGSVWIKVDTGMTRLGVTDLQATIQRCRQQRIGIAGILSHLACADTAEHPLNRIQRERFHALRRNAEQLLGRPIAASLLNSAGMVTLADQMLDMVRPGIALYGAEPVIDQPLGVKPVMQLHAPIIQIRDIAAGTPVSYGASFTAPQTMRIAVIRGGYGDGLPRALSNRGCAWFDGQQLPIVGRVCMDYTMLDITRCPLKIGDRVELWGNHLAASAVAAAIDTISYTLFTGIHARVARISQSS